MSMFLKKKELAPATFALNFQKEQYSSPAPNYKHLTLRPSISFLTHFHKLNKN